MSVVFPIEPDSRFRLSTAAGGETSFSVPFPFQDNADILVQKNDLAGVTHTFTEGADYTLTGAGNPSGGAIALAVPAVAGEIFIRIGQAVLDRTNSVVSNGKFASGPIDDDFDRTRIIQQEQARDLTRAWKTPFGQTGKEIFSGDPLTMALFDANGNINGGGPTFAQIQAIETGAETSATNAAASETAAALVLSEAQDLLAGAGGIVPGNAINDWRTGKAPAILQRSVPNFLMPEMYIGLDTQIVYMEPANPMDASGATDFASAFAAMRAEMLESVGDTEWPPGWERQKFAIALQPGKRYAVRSGLNFTRFQTRGLPFFGNGAQIFADYADGTAVFDLLGSAGWGIYDLSIESDNGKSPALAFLIGRCGTEVAENMSLHNVRLDGWWKKAGGYNYGSELFEASGNFAFFSYNQHVPGWLIDSTNSLDVATLSQATSITATAGTDTSNVQHNFIGGAIRNVQGNENGALGIISTATGNLNNVRGVKLSGTYITNTTQGISGTAGPAVRVKGPVSGLELNIHAEAGAADSVINLSHLVYFDVSDSYNPLTIADLKVHEYVGEFEIAMFGRSDSTSNLELVDVDIHCSESLGQYPAATYAPMWEASTFLPSNTKVSGKIGIAVRGGAAGTFDNMNLVSFEGDLNLNGGASTTGLGAGASRVRVNTTNSATRGWDHASIIGVAANGAATLNNGDIIEITGSVTAISLSNGTRYRSFDVINVTTGYVTVSGLAGPDQVMKAGTTMHVTQFGTAFYAESTKYGSVFGEALGIKLYDGATPTPALRFTVDATNGILLMGSSSNAKLQATDTGIGFYAGTPVGKQTVNLHISSIADTDVKAALTALASLLSNTTLVTVTTS